MLEIGIKLKILNQNLDTVITLTQGQMVLHITSALLKKLKNVVRANIITQCFLMEYLVNCIPPCQLSNQTFLLFVILPKMYNLKLL